MSDNTTQPRFGWCVIEIPNDIEKVDWEVAEMRKSPGRLPDNKRIIGRFENRVNAELFERALRREMRN